MPTYTFNYDVRHYNGTISIDAPDEETAREIFGRKPIKDLVDKTCDVDVDIESVEEEESE